MTSLDSLAGTANAGTLYGIGVGPGDVRYLTLRAAGLVRAVDVVAFFAKKGVQGNARRIVAPLMGEERAELRLEYPVTDEIPAGHPDYQSQIAGFYRESSERLASLLKQGQSVGLIAEGDPFFYGSFMHLYARLEGVVPVRVVPGITGMSGAWTVSGTPITWGDDMLTVLMATLPEEDLARRIRDTDALAVMKVGRNLPKLRRAVAAAGREDEAWLVEYATMPEERVTRLRDASDATPYFSILLIHGQGRRP